MFSSSDYLTLPVLACVAVLIDFIFGEPKRYHPLVGFGWLATQLEAQLNPRNMQLQASQKWRGLVGITLLIMPIVWLAHWLCSLSSLHCIANVGFLYFAIGHKSLHDHANAVLDALKVDDVSQAKTAASYMVSRDSAAIEPVSATIESVLENGNDGVFGALFWFFIAGGEGALAFRLINTMDAMWGYKTARYYYFGWAAARLDDLISYIPARLTALSYACLGHTKIALNCWKNQAPLWDSPNAGPVMSAGAGSLNIKLGGPACYHGEWHMRPTLGTENTPSVSDISRALALVRHSVYLWLATMLAIELLAHA